MTLTVSLEPWDTLHFAEGRPFNQDDEGLTEAASLFPPLPHQVADAVRAAIALALGAPEPTRHRWSPSAPLGLDGAGALTFGDIVGDGRWDYGALRFSGLRLSDTVGRDWVPCPLTALQPPPARRGAGYYVAAGDAARPIESAVAWDIGGVDAQAIAFGEVAEDVDKTAPVDWFMERGTFLDLLADPDELISGGEIAPLERFWSSEKYLGITLDPPRKATVTGLLYTATHLRPNDSAFGEASRLLTDVELALDPALQALVIDRLKQTDMFAPLGGRGRAARIVFAPGPPADRTPPSVAHGAPAVRVYLVTPALIDAQAMRLLRPGGPFLGVPGARLIAAVCERAQRTALWDGGAGGRTAWMWRLPAGAVFEIALPDPGALMALSQRLHDAGLNIVGTVGRDRQARAMGYGETMMGLAPAAQAGAERIA